MINDRLKFLLYDYFFLIGILVVSTIFLKKFTNDFSWLLFNIIFWLSIIVASGLLQYDKYYALIVQMLVSIVIIVSFLCYKAPSISNFKSSSNNVLKMLGESAGSVNLFYGLLIIITILTMICYLAIMKQNKKTNFYDFEEGEEGKKGKEGEQGDKSDILDNPNEIVYKNLRQKANDYFIKRKRDAMKRWDYNNREKYYKEEMPSVFDFDERHPQLKNIFFFQHLYRICYSPQFNDRLSVYTNDVFLEEKQKVDSSLDMNKEYEYRTNIEYKALKRLLDHITPSIESVIDQICPLNQKDDKYFLGIKHLDKEIESNHELYKRISPNSFAYNDNIWNWGKKGCE